MVELVLRYELYLQGCACAAAILALAVAWAPCADTDYLFGGSILGSGMVYYATSCTCASCQLGSLAL
jgi:hypothetical protein